MSTFTTKPMYEAQGELIDEGFILNRNKEIKQIHLDSDEIYKSIIYNDKAVVKSNNIEVHHSNIIKNNDINVEIIDQENILFIGYTNGNHGSYNSYTHDGVNWIHITEEQLDMTMYDLKYANNMYVSVGDGTHTIAYSYDGKEWVGLGKNIFSSYGHSLIYEKGVWVARGRNTNSIAYSYDGINWVGLGNIFSSYSVSFAKIAYGNGLFLASGYGSSNNLAYSYDGINWNIQSVILNGSFTKIISVFYNDGLWLCGAESNISENVLKYSYDGFIWYPAKYQDGTEFIHSYSIYDIAYGNNVYVAGTYYKNSSNTAFYSYDGITWYGLGVSLFNYSIISITFFKNTFWVCGNQSGRYIMYSYDGINWNNIEINPSPIIDQTPKMVRQNDVIKYGNIHFSRTIYLACGKDKKNKICWSYRGNREWNESTTMFNTSSLGVSTNGSLWIGCGEDISNNLAYSYDGFKWEGLGNKIFTNKAVDVVYYNKMWVSVGNNRNAIAYSSDGFNWTGIGMRFSNGGLCVKHNGTRWFAGGDSTGHAIAYSDDGISWTTVDCSLNVVRDIYYSDSIIIAVGDFKNGKNMAYSQDNGESWTATTNTKLYNIYGIVKNDDTWVSVGTYQSIINNISDNITDWNGGFEDPALSGYLESDNITLTGWTYDTGNGTFQGDNEGPILDTGGWTGNVLAGSGSRHLGLRAGQSITKTFTGTLVAGETYIFSFKAITRSSNIGQTSPDKGKIEFSYNNSVIYTTPEIETSTPISFSTTFVATGNIHTIRLRDDVTKISNDWTTFIDDLTIIQYDSNYPENDNPFYISYTQDVLGISEWTDISAVNRPFSGQGNKVVYTGQKFVAVGQGITNTVAISSDGIFWTGKGNDAFNTGGLGVSYDGSKLIAGGTDSSGNVMAYSLDHGENWYLLNSTSSVFTVQSNAAEYNGEYWIAMGEGIHNTIAISRDGKKWQGLGNYIFSIRGNHVYYDERSKKWIATGEGSSNTIAYSYDSYTWNGLGNAIFSTSAKKVSCNGRIWIAVGEGTNTIAYSYDGLSWTGLGSTVFSTRGIDVVWSGIKWNAVGEGTNTMAYSYDGINWDTDISNNVLINKVNSISYYNNLWIAGGDGITGTTTQQLIDPDGTWIQKGQILEGDNSNDLFGFASAITPDGSFFAVVGPLKTYNSGYLRVYQYISDTWTQVGQTINGIKGFNNNVFASVSLSHDGSIVAVGGGGDSNGYGIVEVYENQSNTWVKIGSDISGNSNNARLGYSLELSQDGSTLITGSVQGDGLDDGPYAVVYKNINGVWSQVGDIFTGGQQNLNGSPHGFDVSISSDGSIIAFGIRQKNTDLGNNAGEVMIYEYVDNSWNQLGQTLQGSAASKYFGTSVSLSGNGHVIAIGEGGNSDEVFVYKYDTENQQWNQSGNSIYSIAPDQFGWTVALSKDGTTIVASTTEKNINGNNIDYVKVFKQIDGYWKQVGNKIIGNAKEDDLGISVSINSDGTVIGIGASGVNNDAGNAIVYEIENAFFENIIPTGYTLAYSSDGLEWKGIDATAFFTKVNNIYHNGNFWMATGEGSNTMAYSINGIDWIPNEKIIFNDSYISNTSNRNISNIALKTKIIAFGEGTNTIAYTTDGHYWTGQENTVFTDFATNGFYNGKMWIAVGKGTNSIATSINGDVWNGLGTSIFTVQGNGVTYASNLGLWVAVGNGKYKIAYSQDGTNWTGIDTSVFISNGNNVSYNGHMFVAVGKGVNSIATSIDGITWTGRGNSIFSTEGNSVIWCGSKWVATGSGTNTIAYSSDGINWTGIGNSIFSLKGNGLSYNGVLIIATGKGTNTLATSIDGITWTHIGTSVFSDEGKGVNWNGEKWIASGKGTNSLAYSYNGFVWTGIGSSIFTTVGNSVLTNNPVQYYKFNDQLYEKQYTFSSNGNFDGYVCIKLTN